MIADLYPPERRSTAMAIFGTGINWGILIGFLVGGWINEWYGWRVAFLVVGLPGILLALAVQLTVEEPPRDYSEALKTESKPPRFWIVVSFMWCSPVLRHIVIAGSLVSFAGYASVIWVPIYLVRIHEMGTGEVGSYLALLIGVGGAVGIYLGGRVTDFMAARRGQQWLPWVVALSSLLILPLLYLTFMAQTPMAAAINLSIINIIGLGLGPFSVGLFSDLFAQSYGAGGLRWGLTTTIVILLWGVFHYWRCGVMIKRQFADALSP